MGQTPNWSKIDKNLLTSPKVNMLKFAMSILIWVSNGDVQRSNRICSQDQHSQAEHWLRQAQLMHAQHNAIGLGPKCEQGKGGRPPLPQTASGPRPMLSMHELSLPEPMLSLSMLILATHPAAAFEVTIRFQNQN